MDFFKILPLYKSRNDIKVIENTEAELFMFNIEKVGTSLNYHLID